MTTTPDRSVYYDELLTSYGETLTARSHAIGFFDWFQKQSAEALASGRHDADLLFRRVGITFNVYGDQEGAERLIPFDLIPRILTAAEWSTLERGLDSCGHFKSRKKHKRQKY